MTSHNIILETVW